MPSLSPFDSPQPGNANTDQTDRTEDAGTHALELSGAVWVDRFPTSTSVEDLSADFRRSVNSFIDAIKNAGGSVTITATYRPPERAYLMHYAWEVARGKVKPNAVPAMTGVNIQWDHGDEKASRQAAADMVRGYNIVYRPSLTTNHANQTAIDMSISGMIGKKIKNKDGEEIEIKTLSDLNAVGATYGVHKNPSDPPHWSADVNGR